MSVRHPVGKTCLVYTRDMAHLYIMTWLIHMCDMTHAQGLTFIAGYSTIVLKECMWRCYWIDLSTRVPWLIYMRDMTHSYVWHDSCTGACHHIQRNRFRGMYVTLLLPHVHVCHGPFVYVPWLIHMCDMTHAQVLTFIAGYSCIVFEEYAAVDKSAVALAMVCYVW